MRSNVQYPLGGITAPVISPRGFSLRRLLFSASEAGFLLDFADTAPLYQDNLAATPLTLPDQSVGLAADRSRARSPITVAAAVQATLGLRPKWGRMPKTLRRNFLTYTEQFDNAAWVKINGGLGTTPTVTSGFTDPDGGNTAWRLVANSGGSGTADYSVMRQTLASTAGARSIYIKSNTGASHIIYFGAPQSGSALTVTTSWTRVTFNAVAASLFFDIGAFPFTASGGSGTTADVLIWHPQLELGSTATAYQRVNSQYDVTEAGLPSYGYIRPDLFDDYLTVTTPAAQTGDVMVFGRRGSWLETGVAYGSGAAVAIGPTTMTGLPAGLLQAVQGPVSDISGGLVGVLAIGRTMTEAERTAALNYYKARGAAGLLVAGADVNPDPGFDNPAAWSFTGVAPGWSVSGGKAECTATASGNRWIANLNRLTIGVTYLITADVVVTSGSCVPDVSSSVVGYASTSGKKKWLATASITGLQFIATNNFVGSIDNVTFQPLTVTP